uniref:Uncharacterized protein n=1 Tax=Kalanchoe fedtschenkoi TaxID=63787 RepID=A0A7N0REQ9_KALFE
MFPPWPSVNTPKSVLDCVPKAIVEAAVEGNDETEVKTVQDNIDSGDELQIIEDVGSVFTDLQIRKDLNDLAELLRGCIRRNELERKTLMFPPWPSVNTPKSVLDCVPKAIVEAAVEGNDKTEVKTVQDNIDSGDELQIIEDVGSVFTNLQIPLDDVKVIRTKSDVQGNPLNNSTLIPLVAEYEDMYMMPLVHGLKPLENYCMPTVCGNVTMKYHPYPVNFRHLREHQSPLCKLCVQRMRVWVGKPPPLPPEVTLCVANMVLGVPFSSIFKLQLFDNSAYQIVEFLFDKDDVLRTVIGSSKWAVEEVANCVKEDSSCSFILISLVDGLEVQFEAGVIGSDDVSTVVEEKFEGLPVTPSTAIVKLASVPHLLWRERALLVRCFTRDAVQSGDDILRTQKHKVLKAPSAFSARNCGASGFGTEVSSAKILNRRISIMGAPMNVLSGSSRVHPTRGFSSGADLPPHQEIGMPSLSPTMTEGNIASWLKKKGDKISSGDVLSVIETDKTTVELECMEEGYLIKIIYRDGSKEIKVGEVIAITVEDEDDVEKFKDYTPKKSDAAAAPPAAQPSAPAPPEKEETKELKSPSPAKAPTPSPAPSSGDRVFASPLARKLAEENNEPISSIKGTGPEGCIVKADVEEYLASRGKEAVAATPKTKDAAAAPIAGLNYTDIPFAVFSSPRPPEIAVFNRTLRTRFSEGGCNVRE